MVVCSASDIYAPVPGCKFEPSTKVLYVHECVKWMVNGVPEHSGVYIIKHPAIT